MTAPRVLKFGGAALRDGTAVERACDVLAAQGGTRPIVVVSAHQGVTDLLESTAFAAAGGRVELDALRIRHRTLLATLGLPSELLDRHFMGLAGLFESIRRRGSLQPAELDLALSFGERMSARVVAHALRMRGVEATPVDAYDLGFVTDSNHGCARPLDGIAGAIRAAIATIPGVAVVTGFLAKDERGNLTTLGRNGSDLTASLLAEAVAAEEIQYWKSVGGILTADPELVPDARVIDGLTHEEAAECAFHGARILHPAAVAPALRAGIPVRVCNVNEPNARGTVFIPGAVRSGPVAVASKADVLRVDVPLDVPERRSHQVAELFSVLDACGVTPGWIFADGNHAGAIFEAGPGVPAALAQLGATAQLKRGLATVAVIGQGLGGVRPLGLKALQTLHDAGVPVLQACLGEREASQAFLVSADRVRDAVVALHGALLAGSLVVEP